MIINVPLNIPDELWANALAKDYEDKVVKSLTEEVRKCIADHDHLAYYSRDKSAQRGIAECGEFSHTAFSDGYLQDYIKKNFEVREDSAEKKEVNYHAKQDYGKAKLTLVPRRILWDIAAIREYGNNKYPEGGPDNWKAVEVDRYRDATFRHLLYYLDDPHGVDKESGLPHLWHLACNIAFICEIEDMYLSKNPDVVKRLKNEFLGYQPPSEEGEESNENLSR